MWPRSRTSECITSGYEAVLFTFRDQTDPQFQALRQWADAVEPTGFLVDLTGERTMVIAPKPNRALDLRLTYVPILDNLTTGTDTLQLPASAVAGRHGPGHVAGAADGFQPDGGGVAADGAPDRLAVDRVARAPGSGPRICLRNF